MAFELSGKIADMSIEFVSGKPKLTLLINERRNAEMLYDEFHDCDKLEIKIDKYREKRSLDANRYMWKLCGELAEKLSDEKVKHTKEDIYRDSIKEIGVWYDDEVELDQVKRRRTSWEMIGTGWITESVDFSKDGKKEIIRFYFGSSVYNTKQMSRLIDNIVQDCEAVGIETKTPDEIANMLSLWESSGKRG